MKPIEDEVRFKDVDLNDLKETQRKITLRIKKIRDDGSEQVKTLKKELYYWSNKVLYKKARFMCKEIDDLKSKIKRAIDVLEN
jgi:hypothetical protein